MMQRWLAKTLARPIKCEQQTKRPLSFHFGDQPRNRPPMPPRG